MKKLCEFLREHIMKIINFKKEKMKLLTKEQQKSYENAKICYICQEKFENKYQKDKKKYYKVRGTAHSACKTGKNSMKCHIPEK